MAKGKPGRPKGLTKTEFNSRFIEGLRTAVSSEDWYTTMRNLIHQMKDPKDQFKAMIELTKFIHPQMAAMQVQVESTEHKVEKIVFMPAQMPTKTLKSEEQLVIDAHASEARDPLPKP